MKLKQLSPLLFGIILLASSCNDDDQEFGFNISKEENIDLLVEYETDEVAAATGLNPPAVTQELELAEIDEFSDALNDLNDAGTIVINNMSYEISGISAGEETDLDELTISATAGGQVLELISLTGTLSNVSKTLIPLTQSELALLQTELLGAGNSLTNEVNIDFAAIPSEDISMDVKVFFDITLKIRE